MVLTKPECKGLKVQIVIASSDSCSCISVWISWEFTMKTNTESKVEKLANLSSALCHPPLTKSSHLPSRLRCLGQCQRCPSVPFLPVASLWLSGSNSWLKTDFRDAIDAFVFWGNKMTDAAVTIASLNVTKTQVMKPKEVFSALRIVQNKQISRRQEAGFV